jgi:hypothetical protein
VVRRRFLEECPNQDHKLHGDHGICLFGLFIIIFVFFARGRGPVVHPTTMDETGDEEKTGGLAYPAISVACEFP